MESIEQLIRDLPDADGARRFLGQLAETQAAAHAKLVKKPALLSDALTLASFSPLLATTLLQNPEYLWWLDKRRANSGVRSCEELVESLARFTLTNSTLETPELFARFRRRELLRIYLRDIRRLATIAEITEEISNLADATLESALKLGRSEIDKRYGPPQETDEKSRATPARFCIVALGKLGSRELNYSSDIDLLFLYSDEGLTTGRRSRGQVTNREYFVKLAEYVTKLVGTAYRVDLRLRPHGSLGALTLSVPDTVRYFKAEARAWERQVLIRSRSSAGDAELFRGFFADVEDLIFSKTETAESALQNVRRSKERIDSEQIKRRGFDVKLGRGGIREIEFLAQALQLAHGGRDRWLRIPHTLISLDRLADRGHIAQLDLPLLARAYAFLRRTEHVLQMENGLQTHTVPDDIEKRSLVAARMNFASTGRDFERGLTESTAAVSRIFESTFAAAGAEAEPRKQWEGADGKAEPFRLPSTSEARGESAPSEKSLVDDDDLDIALDAASPSDGERKGPTFPAESQKDSGGRASVETHIRQISPHFASMFAANPRLTENLTDPDTELADPDYFAALNDAIDGSNDFGVRLSAIRRVWSHQLLEIVVRDIYQTIDIREAKRLQTKLAEASISVALRIVSDEMKRRYRTKAEPDLAILALGKLGGRGVDYDSDLDLLIVYFDPKRAIAEMAPVEYYSRVVEMFVTVLSSMTRDGNLYRVDLRLRPFGSKGMSAISVDAFLDYMQETAAVWEMLAFVKLRAVGGLPEIGENVERETRRIIHERAQQTDSETLSAETRRVRLALETDRSRIRRSGEIDIKYGPGGMLDVYFAMRYLQLLWNVPDAESEPSASSAGQEMLQPRTLDGDRSTPFMLDRLMQRPDRKRGLDEPLKSLMDGYQFLSQLDHNLRLTVGRTTRVPVANHDALKTIAMRMHLDSADAMLESLTLHRLAIRAAFDEIVDSQVA